MFPLILVFFRKNLRMALNACLLICAAALAWRLTTVHILNFPPKYPYIATDARLDSIVYGCAMSLYLHLNPSGRLKETLTGFIPTAIATLILLFCFVYRDDAFRQTFRYSLQGIAIGIGILNLYFFKPFSKISHWMEIAPLRYTGKISYGLYLWHIPIILYLDQYTNFQMGTPIFILLAFGLTYLVSGASFRFVEQPIIDLRRKFGSHVQKEKGFLSKARKPKAPVVHPAE